MSVIDINKITLKNFLSYGNKKQEFVPKGLTFITGFNPDNDRKNYTGKSSLLKSIPFSLFGQVDGITKSRLINWKNRKGLETEVFFNKNGNEYVISRGIKPDYLKVTENGKELPTPPDKRNFQKEIEEDLLQMTYSTFMNTVYADNNNTSSILTLSKPQKRAFLEQMFDLQYYTKLKDSANKRILEIKKWIDEIKTRIEYKTKEIESLKEQIQEYESTLKNLHDSNPELKRAEAQLEAYENKFDEITQKNDVLFKEKEMLSNEIQVMERTYNKIDNKIKMLYSLYVKKDVQPVDIGSIKKNIEEKTNEIDMLKKSIVRTAGYPDEHIKRVINDRAETQAKIKILNNEITELVNKINNKLVDGVCPTCMQKVDHSLIENTLNEQKKDKDVQLQKYHSNLAHLIKESDKIEKSNDILKENERILKEASKLELSIERLNDELKKSKEIQKSYNNKIKYTKVIDMISKTLKKVKDQTQSISNKKYELDIKQEKIDKFFNKLTELRKDVIGLKSAIKREQEEKERINKWVNDNNTKIETLSVQIGKDRSYTEEQKNLLDYYNILKSLTADEEAKQYTISSKVPLLNKRVNHYLSRAGVNFYTKIDSWLETEIRGPGIKDCSFENLSGAERVSIDRALSYSFHDISKLQSPTYLNLMVLDEIIGSSALDKIGLQNLMNIVKIKQVEDNLNVLVVSHSTEILENSEEYFDNKYCIMFDNGYSRIERMD